MLVKLFDNKMVKTPYNYVIFPLTQPQEANQKKKDFTVWLDLDVNSHRVIHFVLVDPDILCYLSGVGTWAVF